MTLSIITINLNNASGLEKTMISVLSQSFRDFEYVVIDGASTDGSVEAIKRIEPQFGGRLKWVSEPDSGIYNAMNKGIKIAVGEYLQFLNSGDCLVDKNVVGNMCAELERTGYPSILYGNMRKAFKDATYMFNVDHTALDMRPRFLEFYHGTLNHSPAYIKHTLFEKYGMYDESLKIVSDWKWYLQSIIFGEEKPMYVDVDVTVFDMYGISESNKELDRKERRAVLEKMVPGPILRDYDDFSEGIDQMKRLKRHPWAYKLVWFLERCLFKMEKWQNRRRSIVSQHK